MNEWMNEWGLFSSVGRAEDTLSFSLSPSLSVLSIKQHQKSSQSQSLPAELKQAGLKWFRWGGAYSCRPLVFISLSQETWERKAQFCKKNHRNMGSWRFTTKYTILSMYSSVLGSNYVHELCTKQRLHLLGYCLVKSTVFTTSFVKTTSVEILIHPDHCCPWSLESNGWL